MITLDTSGERPVLTLYGLIAAPGWWSDDDVISADSVLRALAPLDPAAELHVRLNSDGGDVFQGIAIYQALARRTGRVTIHVDALAASIASVIAMAGDEIVIGGNAMMMIHQASTIAYGDTEEMARMAGLLRQVDRVILDTYAARVGHRSTRDQIEAWVAAETWMTARECVDRGFADNVGPLQAGVAAAGRAAQYRSATRRAIETAASLSVPPPQTVQPSVAPGVLSARIRTARARARAS